MKENLLVTLADRNYINQAKQLFSSVYWNAGWKGDYMLLAHEIPEKDLKWFRDKGILVKRCKSIYKKSSGNYFLNYWRGYPATIFDIFYIFTPEFKKWKNIVALEGDVIVRASLDKLTNLRGFWGTGVSKSSKLATQFADNKIPEIIKKKYNLNKPSFNPGLIAFSTDIIKDNSFNNIKKLSDTYRKITNGNEGIFNLFFYGKWKRLNPLYNVSPNEISFRFGIKEEKIKGIALHFVGEFGKDYLRPWNSKNYFYQEWKSNLNKADLIDLNNIPEGKKISIFRILLDSSYKYTKRYLSFNKIHYPHYFRHLLDKILGLIGHFIKKHNPNLYIKLKNTERKIRNEKGI